MATMMFYSDDVAEAMTSERDDNPEAMFDLLSIQTLRERYQETEHTPDDISLINDQEFEDYVRDFPIDDSISECFISAENTGRPSLFSMAMSQKKNSSYGRDKGSQKEKKKISNSFIKGIGYKHGKANSDSNSSVSSVNGNSGKPYILHQVSGKLTQAISSPGKQKKPSSINEKHEDERTVTEIEQNVCTSLGKQGHSNSMQNHANANTLTENQVNVKESTQKHINGNVLRESQNTSNISMGKKNSTDIGKGKQNNINTNNGKQNKLKKKLQRQAQEENILSDEESKSSDSKKSKLISNWFGRKNKNKDGVKTPNGGTESPDITNAIIDACHHITNSYTKGKHNNHRDNTSVSSDNRRTERDSKHTKVLDTPLKPVSPLREMSPPRVNTEGTPRVNTEGTPNVVSKNLHKRDPALSDEVPPSDHRKAKRDSEFQDLLEMNDSELIKMLLAMSEEELIRKSESANGSFLEQCIHQSRQEVTMTVFERCPQIIKKDHLLLVTKLGQDRCVKCILEQWSLHGDMDQTLMNDLFTTAVQNGKACTLQEIIPYYTSDQPSSLPRDPHGNTAAHLAARNGQIQCLQVMLENGFDIWSLNNMGQSPMSVALDKGEHCVYRYLILYQTCQCLLQETLFSKRLNQCDRTRRFANHSALEQIQEQLLRCQEQFNEVMRDMMATQEAILQTLDTVVRDAMYIANKSQDNIKIKGRLDLLKAHGDQLQDLCDFSPFANSTEWMGKVIKEFQNVIEHDTSEIQETINSHHRDLHQVLSAALRNASSCNQHHICNIPQCVESQVQGAINTLLMKVSSCSSVSPGSSKSGYDTKHLSRPYMATSPRGDTGHTTRSQDLSLQHDVSANQAKSQHPSTANSEELSSAKVQARSTDKNSASNKKDLIHSENIYVNEVIRVPDTFEAPSRPWHEYSDIQSETTVSDLPVLESPSNTDSVCSTVITSGVLESDWTSRLGTITCDTSESGSDWWDKSPDRLRVSNYWSTIPKTHSEEESDGEGEGKVCLNLAHEELPDSQLMQHRLQKHLQSVDRMTNPRGEFTERVVTAKGRRVGKSLDPCLVKDTNQHGQAKSNKKSRSSREKKKRGIKLFSASDVESDEEQNTQVHNSRRGLAWNTHHSLETETPREEIKPWYEMSEDEESTIQSLKSEEEDDDASLVCNI